MAETNEYVLVEDDDGHWYVCPAEREAEFSAWEEAVRAYYDDEDEEGDGPPPEPDFLEKVGGAPSLVRFTGYRIV